VTEYGTPKFFALVLDRELMQGGVFALPFNMPPPLAQMVGESSMVMDLVRYDSPDFNNEPEALQSVVQPGKTFWNVLREQNVALAWIPFFTNCDGYDSHIILWDFLEQPEGR
jgi:hypothetical protein